MGKATALVFIKNEPTQAIRPKEIIAAKSGLINQERTILPSWDQLTPVKLDVATMPAPRYAPMTVCVPEMGMPKNDEHIMKAKEAKTIENIMRT